MRIDEVPVIETHLVESAEAPGGIGEAATAAVSPAVANAIFAATGKRLRRLPFDTDSLKSSSRRSEEHTSELQSLMRISYAVFCLKHKKTSTIETDKHGDT